MANRNSPSGFTPSYHLTGGVIRVSEYTLKQSVTVFAGDALKIDAAGVVDVAAAGGGTANLFIGISAEYKVAPATGITKLKVYDDPNIVYRVQSDAGGTAFALTDVFATADLSAAVSGSAVTKQSGMQWGQASIGSTAVKDLKCIGIIESPDNAVGAYVKLHVLLNNHALAKGVAGI